jgi:phytoene dehydrogenase-like protein
MNQLKKDGFTFDMGPTIVTSFFNWFIRPPTLVFFSNIVTSWPWEAIRAAAANPVTKNTNVGGRMNQLKKDGFTFDMGPTIVMMPDVYKVVTSWPWEAIRAAAANPVTPAPITAIFIIQPPILVQVSQD